MNTYVHQEHLGDLIREKKITSIKTLTNKITVIITFDASNTREAIETIVTAYYIMML